MTDNYVINVVLGELEVRKRPLEIKPVGGEKRYDGSALENKDFTTSDGGMTGGGLMLGHNVSEIEFEGSQTEVGSSTVSIKEGSVKIVDEEGNDVTDLYDIVTKDGELTVVTKDGGTKAGDLDESGGLPGGAHTVGGGEAETVVVLCVKSAASGSVYLKFKSFGNYNGKGWESASEYNDFLEGQYSFDYLTGSTLKNGGFDEYDIEIDSKVSQYFLPYYMSMSAGSYDIQSSDVKYAGDTSKAYSLKYFNASASDIEIT